MKRRATAIPVGTQFNSNCLNLSQFLQAIAENAGRRDEILKAIWEPGVRILMKDKPASPRNRSLPLEASIQYGLVDKASLSLTAAGEELRALRGKELSEAFARHILLRCGGLRFVEGVREMDLERMSVSANRLAEYLTSRNFPVTPQNGQINSMRIWLADAGIFGRSGRDAWTVDETRLAGVLRIEMQTAAGLAGLSEEHRAYLLALCRLDPEGPVLAADVRKVAAEIMGRSFAHGSLPIFLRPLKDLGLLDLKADGTASGKSSKVWTTDKFKREVLEPFLTETVKSLDPAMAAYFRRRPADIYADLDSTSTHAKGLALEAFAVRVMRLLGLRYAVWRKRARETTGSAEVDVIMTNLSGFVPAVWQIQCKNTPGQPLRLEDVSREVGLLQITKATHLLILSRGPITKEASRFADQTMEDTPSVIYLLGERDFSRVRTNETELFAVLSAQAERVMRLRHATAVRAVNQK